MPLDLVGVEQAQPIGPFIEEALDEGKAAVLSMLANVRQGGLAVLKPREVGRPAVGAPSPSLLGSVALTSCGASHSVLVGLTSYQILWLDGLMQQSRRTCLPTRQTSASWQPTARAAYVR